MQGLEASMNAHLRLAFANRTASDEAVLQGLPTPLRRRILRHMYLEQLNATALFRLVPGLLYLPILGSDLCKALRKPGVGFRSQDWVIEADEPEAADCCCSFQVKPSCHYCLQARACQPWEQAACIERSCLSPSPMRRVTRVTI